MLLILNRSRKRSPNLRPSDRVVVGLCALLMRPGRVGGTFSVDSALASVSSGSVYSNPGAFGFPDNVNGSSRLFANAEFQVQDAGLQPVPEPASLTLFGLGLIGAGARRWRKRRASSNTWLSSGAAMGRLFVATHHPRSPQA